jgi:hypothetical protein
LGSFACYGVRQIRLADTLANLNGFQLLLYTLQKLHLVQFAVAAVFVLQQLVVGAEVLDHLLPCSSTRILIGVADGAQPVGNDKGGARPAIEQSFNGVLDDRFLFRGRRWTRGFVEDENVGVKDEGAYES